MAPLRQSTPSIQFAMNTGRTFPGRPDSGRAGKPVLLGVQSTLLLLPGECWNLEPDIAFFFNSFGVESKVQFSGIVGRRSEKQIIQGMTPIVGKDLLIGYFGSQTRTGWNVSVREFPVVAHEHSRVIILEKCKRRERPFLFEFD